MYWLLNIRKDINNFSICLYSFKCKNRTTAIEIWKYKGLKKKKMQGKLSKHRAVSCRIDVETSIFVLHNLVYLLTNLFFCTGILNLGDQYYRQHSGIFTKSMRWLEKYYTQCLVFWLEMHYPSGSTIHSWFMKEAILSRYLINFRSILIFFDYNEDG